MNKQAVAFTLDTNKRYSGGKQQNDTLKVSPKASEHKVHYGVWKSSRARLCLPHFGCWSDVLCSVKSNPSTCSQACACVCVWRRGKSKLFMGPQLVISLRKFGKMNTGSVLSPPSFHFWIQTFISHKVGVKECVLSLVSCPCAHCAWLSQKLVLLAYSCTSHSVAYLNVSRICKLTLINGFNRKDFLFLFHENKRQGINR